jgi:ABC-2 type transport system permease protein
MVNAFRFGFLGHSDVNVVLAFTVMAVALIALFVLCVWLLDRGTGIRD